MALDLTMEVTEFTSYIFTAEEYAEAYNFTDLHIKGIQTQLAKFAQQKLNLAAADFTSDEVYIRAQEYNRGLMDGMRYLLELHSSLKEQAAENLKAAAERQRDAGEPLPFNDDWNYPGAEDTRNR